MSDKLVPVAVLAMRLWLGLNFVFTHGLGKISDPGPFLEGGTVQKFPVPILFGWLAILSEVAGGTLVTLGLWTRIGAFGILATMLAAGFVAHADDPWRRKELAFTFAVMALFLIIYGGGKYSLDALIRRRKR